MRKFFLASLFLPMFFSLPANAQPVRIMPFGDSITYDDHHGDTRPAGLRGGYRFYLYYLLKDRNYQFDFVGSVRAGYDIIPPFDPDNEGHPGKDATFLGNHVYEYLMLNPANIMLVHVGTNHSSDLVYELNAMQHLLDEIDRFEADYGISIRVILALIIPRENDVFIPQFNYMLNIMAQTRIAQGDNIVIVDMYHDAGLTEDDWSDGTHPNDKGYEKMAKVWLNPILLKRKDSLYLFSTQLVKRKYILSATVDEKSGISTVETTIPDDGIRF